MLEVLGITYGIGFVISLFTTYIYGTYRVISQSELDKYLKGKVNVSYSGLLICSLLWPLVITTGACFYIVDKIKEK